MKRDETALRWIVGVMRDFGVPFLAAGGLAARAYGAHRDLVDLDFYVPGKYLEALAKAAGNLLVRPPSHLKGELWEIEFLAMEHEGIRIELAAAEGARYFDRKAGVWRDARVDFRGASHLRVLGVEIPVMPLADLVDYKRALDREVDRADLAEIDPGHPDGPGAAGG